MPGPGVEQALAYTNSIMGLGFLIAALLSADCWNRLVLDAKPIPNPKDEVDSFFISLVFEIDLCSKLM